MCLTVSLSLVSFLNQHRDCRFEFLHELLELVEGIMGAHLPAFNANDFTQRSMGNTVWDCPLALAQL